MASLYPARARMATPAGAGGGASLQTALMYLEVLPGPLGDIERAP